MKRADPLEKAVERYLFRQVRALGGMAIKIAPIVAGAPDRVVLLGGKTFWVELKRANGTVSPIQLEWHRRAAKIGVPVYVLYGEAGVKSWLRAVVDGPPKKPGRKRSCGCEPNTLLSTLTWDGTEQLPGD